MPRTALVQILETPLKWLVSCSRRDFIVFLYVLFCEKMLL